MKMKKRGFTLIELLAVIIILTILTFIVIFFVDPMLNDSEEKNIELSVKNYIKAIENNVLSSRLEDINVKDGSYSVMPNGDLCLGEYSSQTCDGKVLKLELKEGKPVSGTVVIENKTVVAGIDVNINNRIVSWGNEGSVIVQGTVQKPVITIKDTSSFSDNILINYVVESEIGIKEYSCVYGIDETYGNVGIATNNSCKLTNLIENETYYYKIIVTDSKGNEAYATGSLKASDIVAPEIAITPSGYAMSKVALITYNNIKITSPEYYFYSTIDGQSDIEVYNCGVDSSKPSTCSEIKTTTLEKNTWYRTTSTKVNITYKDNGTLIARTSDGTNYKSSTQALITGVDKYAPEIVLNSITNSTNSIVINYNATDDQAIKSYSCEYGLDKNYGNKANITENNCVINGLKQDTTYYYKITVTDVVGRKTIKEGSSITSDIQAPTIAITPSGWAKSKVAKITYDRTNITSPEYYFYSTITGEVDTEVSSCGTDSKIPSKCTGTTTIITSGTWYKTISSEINITTNVTGTVIARTTDGNNYKASAQGSITMIDNTIPVNIALNSNSDTEYEKSKSVNVTISDTLSGLALNNNFKYGWSKTLDEQPTKYETITPSYKEGITEASFDIIGENLTGDYYLWIVPTKYEDIVENANITTVKSTGTFKFDNEAPIIDIESVVNNDNDLVISYTLTDEQSGVESYSCEYGTDNTYGNTASATSTGCTISNVDSSQTYYYKITSTDKLGNSGYILGSTSAAIISVTPSGWAKSKTANIKYIDTGIEGIEYYFYSTVDAISDKNVSNCGTDSSTPTTRSGSTTSISANTWYKTTELEINLTYNKQGTLIARMSDSNGYKSSAQAAITKIDTIVPTIKTVTATNEWGTTEKITINATDDESGVVEYMLTTTSNMPDENSSDWQESNEFNVSSNTTWYAWAKDAVGNISAYKTVTNSHVCLGIWDVSKNQDETVHGILKLYGTLLITGKGETYNYNGLTDRPYNSLSSKITSVVVEEGVTSLGSRFLQSINTIKTISFPSTLTKIEYSTFEACTGYNVDGITIAEGNTSFVFENGTLYNSAKTVIYTHSRNDSVTEYTIPSTVTYISHGAFYYNKNITTLNVSSKFDLGWQAFNGCTNLTTINSTAGNTTINGVVGNTTINPSAFFGTKIDNVKLSKNLTLLNKSGTTYYEPFAAGEGTIYYYGSNSVVVDYIENTTDTLTWKAIATVTLDPNGGSVNKTEIEAVYEETYGAHDKLPTPTRSGYTFIGWYSEASGGTKITDSSSTLKSTDHTLYARWQKAASDLEVTLNPTSYTYDGTAKKPTVTVKDGSTTLVKDTDYTVAYKNNTNAGTATVTITAKGVYNSTSQATYTGTTSKTFTINKANSTNPTLTKYEGTYDGAAHTFTLSGGAGGTVQYSTDGGTTWGTTKPTRTNVGTTTVHVRILGDSNHNNTTATSTTIKVNARATTVTASGASKTYDGTALTKTSGCASATNLVSGHEATCTNTGTRTNAGSVTNTLSTVVIKDAAGTDVTANYSVTKKNGTLTVNKKQLTVANFTYSPITKVYDGKTTVPSGFKVTPVGIISGDTVTVSYTSAVYNNANVASATSIAVSGMTLGGTSAGNYSLNATSYTKTGATITKAGSTNPTLTKYEGTYDGVAHTFTLSGGAGGTVQYSTDGGTTWGTTKPTRTAVGTTTVHVRILGDSNHNNTTATSTAIKVNAKSVAVTWGTTTTFTYNGAAQAPTASATSGITGETINVTRTTGTNAGDYTSTASCTSVTGGQATCDNYILTNPTEEFTIEKYTPTIELSAEGSTINALSTSTFTATPTTISSCIGTLTATSDDISQVTVTGGASTSNAASGTAVTMTYQGISYTVATPILVSYKPTNTANCNSISKAFTVEVQRVNPSVSLASKTTTYTGSAISANVASAIYNNSDVSLNYTYKYYTDSSCSTQTTTTTGASATGGAPVNVGTYYVKATSTQTGVYNSASSACTLHKINKATPTIKFYNSAGTTEITSISLEMNTNLNYKVYSSVAGTFSYTDSSYTTTHFNAANGAVTAGGKLSAGSLGKSETSSSTSISWKLTPTDTTNYNTVTKSLTVTEVTKIKPVIKAYADYVNSSLSNEITELDLYYTQNTAYYLTSNVAGTFKYTDNRYASSHIEAASSMISANGTLKVGTVGANITSGSYVRWTFTPSNTSMYATVTLDIPLTVATQNSATVGSCKSLTYTGSAQTLVSGGKNVTYTNNSGTNAGSYTVTVKPATNYTWSDGTTTAKTLTCSIGKATPTLYLGGSNANYTYNYITYNRSGNGFTVKSSVAGTIKTTTSNSSYVSITSNASISAAKNTSYTVGIKGADVTSTKTTLTVKLTPTDTTNYNTVTRYVYVNKVAKETPTLTASSSSGSVVKGSSKSYTIKSNVAGSFAITDPPHATYASASISSTATTTAGTTRTITYKGLEYTGLDWEIVVTFTPTDTAHYNTVTHTYTITQVGEANNQAPSIALTMSSTHKQLSQASAFETSYTPRIGIYDGVSGLLARTYTAYVKIGTASSCSEVATAKWSLTGTATSNYTRQVTLVGDTKVSSGIRAYEDTATACMSMSLCDHAGNCLTQAQTMVTDLFERYR